MRKSARQTRKEVEAREKTARANTESTSQVTKAMIATRQAKINADNLKEMSKVESLKIAAEQENTKVIGNYIMYGSIAFVIIVAAVFTFIYIRRKNK